MSSQRIMSLVVAVLVALVAVASAAPISRYAAAGPFTVTSVSSLPALNGLPIAAHSGYFWIGVPSRYGCYPATVCTNATIFNQPSGSTGLYSPDNLTMHTQTATQYAYIKADGRFAYTFDEASDPSAQIAESDKARGFQSVTDYRLDPTGAATVLAFTGIFHANNGGDFYACPGPFAYNEINDPGMAGVNTATYQLYVDTGSLWAENPAVKNCQPIQLRQTAYTGNTPVAVYS